MREEYDAGRAHETVSLERQMNCALSGRDASGYFSACVSLGLKDSGIADIELYERGRDLVGKVSDAIFIAVKPAEGTGEDCRDYWSRIAKIALTRFSELQDGEGITSLEIRKRLRSLRKAGYGVRSCSKMGRSELWDYFMNIKRAVYPEVEKHCPDILREIRASNEMAKRSKDS